MISLLQKLRPFLLSLVLISLFPRQHTFAQSVFNANYNNFNFLAANKIHKVGTDGTVPGNVTLYTNSITIGGQQIDCIIRTVSLSGGTFTLPGGAGAGTIPFDYSSATGTGMSANEDRFFSPTFNWTSAGSCRFRFEFILGGSYNNATNKGTPVILQNVYVNSYDIDGNGSASSNQNNEYAAFNTAQYKTGTGSTLSPSYNPVTGMTRFRSNSTTNTTNVVDDATRVKIGYAQMSSFEIVVGADGGGAAYYFLDFGQGPAWTATPAVFTSPVLDLSTSNSGLDNSVLACGAARYFTEGTSNITSSSNAINEIEILIPAPDILNGNAEILLPKRLAGASDSVKLGLPFSGTQNIVINSVTYQVTRSSAGGINTVRVTPVSGTFTTAQTETFLDSLSYINTSTGPVSGYRNFTVTFRENFVKSVPAVFKVQVNCTLLPVTLLSFSVFKQNEQAISVNWSTANEINAQDYLVQHSTNGSSWYTIAVVKATGISGQVSNYQYSHLSPAGNINFYRLVQRERDGKTNISEVKQVSMSAPIPDFQLMSNPVRGGNLQLRVNEPVILQITGTNGQLLFSQKMNTGMQNINIRNFLPGVYQLHSATASVKFLVQ